MVKEVRIYIEGGGDSQKTKSLIRQGFKESAIPKSANVETISKSNLEPALKTATGSTTKGEYHKIQHAYKLLELLDVDKVCQASSYCDRLFTTLTSKITVLTSNTDAE